MMCLHDKITCFQRVERKGQRREIAERALSIFIFKTLCGQKYTQMTWKEEDNL